MRSFGRHISAEEKLKAQPAIITGLICMYFIFTKILFLKAALVLGLVFLFIPVLGNWFIVLWFRLAELLGWINTRILLSIVYYVFLMPVSFIAGLVNKDPLSLDNTGASLYIDRDHTYTAKDLENIW